MLSELNVHGRKDAFKLIFNNILKWSFIIRIKSLIKCFHTLNFRYQCYFTFEY